MFKTLIESCTSCTQIGRPWRSKKSTGLESGRPLENPAGGWLPFVTVKLGRDGFTPAQNLRCSGSRKGGYHVCMTHGPINLLLVGAGRAHMEVLRRLAHSPIPRVQTTVISPSPRKLYSRMIPGFLQGNYSEKEITVDVAQLASRCGGRFIAGRALMVHNENHEIVLQDLKAVSYDFVSFALGSNTTGDPKTSGSPPAASGDRMAIVRERLLELTFKEGESKVVVAGGGAGGIEIALAIARVLDQAGRSRRVTILGDSEPLQWHSETFKRHAQKILDSRSIDARFGVRCASAEPRLVAVDGGRETFQSDLTVWLTEPVEWTLFTGSKLNLGITGLPRVYPSLQSTSDSRVFSARDCASIEIDPGTEGALRIARDQGKAFDLRMTPETGVYADGETVKLWRSLRTVLTGRELQQFPQARYEVRSFLDKADGLALCGSRGKVFQSSSAMQQKEWMDRRQLARYQS
jgi:selenide, water dikinase